MATAVSAAKKAANAFEGLNPDFASRLQQLIAASGGKISIVSGYRSPERQAQLFAAAVKKYGSEKAARKWVAPPGKSNHNKGFAADLTGDLALAHRLAPKFGLHFPMSWEAWHVEPVDHESPTDAYTTPPDDHVAADPFSEKMSTLSAMFGVRDAPDFLGELPTTGEQGVVSTKTGAQGGLAGIVAAARSAGFTGQALSLAIAIALAESGGNPTARNVNKDKTRSVDRGPWQINSRWHPEVSDAEADDPMTAAQHAYRISGGGQDWNAWSTYKSGAYKKFLGQAQAAIGAN